MTAAPGEPEGMNGAASGLELGWVGDSILDETCKGWPPQMPPTRLRDAAAFGLNLYRGDLPAPVAILRRTALETNSEWMRRFLRRTAAVICPHGKTTMAPQLFARQLADGAWGITVATRRQLAVARRAGVRRLIVANELVAASDMAWVAAELDLYPEVEIYLYVDSMELVARWSEARRQHPGRPIPLLLEVGYAGGRTGARTAAEAIDIATAIHAEPSLRLCGVAGFEGLMHDDAKGSAVERVRAFLAAMVEAARGCAERDLFDAEPVILSAGGSAYYDLVAAAFAGAGLGRPSLTVLRSGCYLTHDHAFYAHSIAQMLERSAALAAETVRPLPALEVWARVQSCPEPGLAICSLGKRDISFDIDLPRPAAWCRPGREARAEPLSGHAVSGLNDQHAMVRVPENGPLRVGDLVGFGVSHPCTTFDRWQVLHVIDEAGTVVEAIRTYF